MKYDGLQKDIIKVLIGEQGLPNMPKGMREPGEDDAPKKPKALEPTSEPKAEKPAVKAEPKSEPKPEPKVAAPHDTTYSDNIDTKVDVPKERGLLSKNAFPREPGEVRFKAPENIKPSPKVMDIPNNNIPTFNTKHYKRYI